jgi:Na+-driven multidrug efflux pump
MQSSFLRGKPVFGPGAFYREALGIVVPVMLQAIITSLISLIDNFMVAGLGDVKMAAVNVANQINFVYIVIVNAACMAGGIFLSQHRGAKGSEGMRQSLRFKLIMALIVAAIHTGLCLLFPEALIRLMLGGNSQGAGIVEEGSRFLRLVAPSFAPIAVAAALGSSYKDVGSTKVPLAVSSVAAAICTFLNWILIYGTLGAPRLEVAGAAIATDIARFVEAAAFIAIAALGKPDFSFKLSGFFDLDTKLFKEILGRSAMMFFSETAWVLSETVITAIYNGRGGAETVAGMAAGWTIANIFFMAFGAVITATSVIVGSTLGSGKLEEARTKGRWILSGSAVFGALVAIVAAASTFLIPIVFGNLSAEAREVTRGLVFVIAVYIPVWTLLNAQFALSRAGGDTAMGVWVDVGVTYAVFLPAAFALASWTSLGPVALFGLAKIADLGKAAVAFWWLAKERWVKNLAAPASTEAEAGTEEGGTQQASAALAEAEAED